MYNNELKSLINRGNPLGLKLIGTSAACSSIKGGPAFNGGGLSKKSACNPLTNKLFSDSTRSLERSIHLKGLKIACLIFGFWFRIERQRLVEVYNVDMWAKMLSCTDSFADDITLVLQSQLYSTLPPSGSPQQEESKNKLLYLQIKYLSIVLHFSH